MTISIIIATMATKNRSETLKRAINSIRTSSTHPIPVIVVVNGEKYDIDVCEWLKSQPDVIFDYLIEPSAPNAIRRGVELVDTEYYGCLDDDDELINMAIEKRLDIIKNKPEIDYVISNGYRHSNGIDQVVYSNITEVKDDPLLHLMKYNWLASCNFIFRKSSIDSDFFHDNHPYAEWTWLAFKLAVANKNMEVLTDSTFRINDTLGSLSKSSEYLNSYIPLFKKMLETTLPSDIKNIIRRKLASAYHEASDQALNSGDVKSAIKLHVQSLFEKGGSKYLSYSRYFLKKNKGK